ncbi:hypothetical protein BGI33_11215 [Snodgrassella alvi]|uniref:Uncharacterized protein n=2 Tax=Snodgrassella alvi TaxID=1196083 RepID=A0A2N9WRC7_9NEIS|nr:hypothetical protein BGI32_10825 [Snodgrassella alvi]PIT13228.1 hypothetical protein BGI33_11215 [Snodgrassella alvi]PIT18744.1 hypothetical protein BGI34_04190 [Snodgrassella alvi]
MFVTKKIKSKPSLIKFLIVSTLLSLNFNLAMAQDIPDDAAPQARIRIFGQNGKPTNMKYSFQGHVVKESTGGNMGGAFASLLGVARNSTIGIPATTTLDTMKQHNHNLSKLYYREFTIPANVPITIFNAIIGLTNVNNTHHGGKIITNQPSCQSKKLTFVAEPGKDYEAIATYTIAKCGVILQEVNADGSTILLLNSESDGQ